MTSWRVTRYLNAFDNRPEHGAVSWPQLCASFSRVDVMDCDDKRNVRCWSAASYPDGATRGKSNVDSVSMLVLDVDDGTPARELLRAFSDWPYIVHTSWSHTPEHAKYRVILPLEVPIPAARWGRVFAWARRMTDGHIDEACKDPSRIWFRPAIRRGGWPFHFVEHDPGGQLLGLDVDRLPMTDDERALERRSRPRPRPRVSAASAGAAVRAARERLKTDPAARERAALRAGGRIRGDRATSIPCPGCGRASVWLLLLPDSFRGAECNHRNSCGWHGWLDELPGVA